MRNNLHDAKFLLGLVSRDSHPYKIENLSDEEFKKLLGDIKIYIKEIEEKLK